MHYNDVVPAIHQANEQLYLTAFHSFYLLYLWQLILAFQFGKGISIGAGIISGLISALMLTGLGDYVWKYVFVCWTGRVPYTYLQSVLGETSVGEWLSFIPGCLIFTGISMVYYFWWVNHWEGNRISE